jgi:hypothetical protein
VFTNFAEYEHLYPTDSYAIAPLAPNLGTGRAHLRALLGVGLSPFIDVHNPLDDAYERIAARAEELELVALRSTLELTSQRPASNSATGAYQPASIREPGARLGCLVLCDCSQPHDDGDENRPGEHRKAGDKDDRLS